MVFDVKFLTNCLYKLFKLSVQCLWHFQYKRQCDQTSSCTSNHWVQAQSSRYFPNWHKALRQNGSTKTTNTIGSSSNICIIEQLCSVSIHDNIFKSNTSLDQKDRNCNFKPLFYFLEILENTKNLHCQVCILDGVGLGTPSIKILPLKS